MLWAWAWVLACGTDGTPDPQGLISPVDGVVTTTAWVPVQFEIRRGEQQEAAAMWLDGVDVTDALGFSRRRASTWGGYADHLATLDLRDVAPGEHLLEIQVGARTGSALFSHEPAACRVDAWIADESGGALAGRVVAAGVRRLTDLEDGAVAVQELEVRHLHRIEAAAQGLGCKPYVASTW